MGGCCCTSRKPHLHATPVCYYCSPALEEHESLTDHFVTATTFPSDLLVDLNHNATSLDSCRPPAPLPFDAALSCRSKSAREKVGASNLRTLTTHDDGELENATETSMLLDASMRTNKSDELSKAVSSAIEEDDTCPICLEEYTQENPKNMINCEHYFHLSCILEWRERSDVCPICDQEMMFDDTFS